MEKRLDHWRPFRSVSIYDGTLWRIQMTPFSYSLFSQKRSIIHVSESSECVFEIYLSGKAIGAKFAQPYACIYGLHGESVSQK